MSLRCRLANKQTSEVQKLSVRGAICNGAAKWSTVKGNEPLPVWFVFSGGLKGSLQGSQHSLNAHEAVVCSAHWPLPSEISSAGLCVPSCSN